MLVISPSHKLRIGQTGENSELLAILIFGHCLFPGGVDCGFHIQEVDLTERSLNLNSVDDMKQTMVNRGMEQLVRSKDFHLDQHYENLPLRRLLDHRSNIQEVEHMESSLNLNSVEELYKR